METKDLEVLRPFGPTIAKVKIPDNLVKELLRLKRRTTGVDLETKFGIRVKQVVLFKKLLKLE